MSLEHFFNPQSVAIVGASHTKGKVGYEILKNMIDAGYPGKIFPVNPKSQPIEGLECFPDLQTIGQKPDLVIIIVPAKIVPSIMQQCAEAGAKSVIIITAGFKEIGKEGNALEKEIIKIARRAGIRIIGPNCLGVVAPANKVNASFGGALPAVGSIGYLSQSGALLTAILDMANANEIGFSKLVNIGNKADVNELDIIKALAEDKEAKVIAGYLESIANGNQFVRQAERISHGKSIRERVLDLIHIAHPKFRKELIQAAKTQSYIYEDQIQMAWDQVVYPEELERYETLRDGTEIFFRPIKPTDEPALSEMMYSLSEKSVRTRYMTYTMAFPHREIQRVTNIDYRQDVAIVGVVPGVSGEEIVAIAQYFLDPKTQSAEVAFVVQDEWQRKGMGTFLLDYITHIAKQRGVKKFWAKVLPNNEPMLAIFHNSGYKINTTFDGEVYNVTYDLT